MQECVEDGVALVEAVITELDSWPVQLLAKLEVHLVFEGCSSFTVLNEVQRSFICPSALAPAVFLDAESVQVCVEPAVASQVLGGDVVGNEVAPSSVGDGGEEFPCVGTSCFFRVLPSRFPFGGDLLVQMPNRIRDGTFRILNLWLSNCFLCQLISFLVALNANMGFHPLQTDVVAVAPKQISYFDGHFVAAFSVSDGLK